MDEEWYGKTCSNFFTLCQILWVKPKGFYSSAGRKNIELCLITKDCGPAFSSTGIH